MNYHKINAIFKRDKNKKIIMDDYVDPIYEVLKNIPWIAYEKIDGTNIHVTYNGKTKEIKIQGRKEKSIVPEGLQKKLNELFTVEKLSSVFFENNDIFHFYGEGVSHKIQKGKRYLNGIEEGFDFILFDILVQNSFDGVYWWSAESDKQDIATQLGIRTAPYMFTDSLLNIIEKVKKGLISTYDNNFAEGVVCKPLYELFNRRGERIITKIKHKDFYQ